MTTLARAHGIRVVLASVPPMHEVPWRPEVGNTLARVARLNAWLRGFAMHHDLLHVDYHARLAQPDGAMRVALTTDGVPLNEAGRSAERRVGQECVSPCCSRWLLYL